MVINSEIDERQKNIDNIQKDITHIEGNIGLLKTQLATLESQLKERQQKYLKSLRYMARHRKIQDQLMFVFSAKNLSQMYRRMRFVREYAAFQRAQGELVKAKTSNMGSLYKLNYKIELKDPSSVQGFLDALRCRNGNLEVAILHAAEGGEEL